MQLKYAQENYTTLREESNLCKSSILCLVAENVLLFPKLVLLNLGITLHIQLYTLPLSPQLHLIVPSVTMLMHIFPPYSPPKAISIKYKDSLYITISEKK